MGPGVWYQSRVRCPARRWLIVAALFAVTYGAASLLAAYGVFLPVIAEAFGWSRGAIATALSLNLVVGGVAGFGAGALADRHGPRLLLVVTTLLATAAFALVATVTALWQLYLFVGVAGGLGMSSFYLLSTSTVLRWFDDRRALAVALVLIGYHVGFITAGPLAAWLIASVGWRAAYAALAAGAGVIALLAALTVRLPEAGDVQRAGDPAPGPAPVTPGGLSLGEALTDGRQWCFNAGWLLLGSLSLMVSVHIVPFARDQGIALAGASLALTAYGVGAITGRLAAGVVSEQAGSRATITAAYAVQVVALLLLVAMPSRVALFAALVAFGAGFGAADTLIAKAIPEVFGVRALGAIIGVLTFGWRAGAAAGPAIAGFLYDATGSYAVPFGAAPVVAAASWVLFTLGSRHR
jgi:MFS family permease